MDYWSRPLRREDVPQVAEIEREAFPTVWPPTPFYRELNSRMACYLVALQRGERNLQQVLAAAEEQGPTASPLWQRWARGIFGLGKVAKPTQDEAKDLVAGYVGIWFALDEAHITAIATKSTYQRRGIGELLIIATIEKAMAKGSRVVTLEVRVSNTGARRLYEKYGFREVGIRRGYYSDNGEDAVIMTTDPISSPDYRARFEMLRAEHGKRWGQSVRLLS
ncbi:MAG: ribosomal protein S18-alanine N-acetyltransferase [Chloroflexi bacterium]|nr:ribosomal protein S18-alanine N-acetyltransferase [Chloroflexota bacterium]